MSDYQCTWCRNSGVVDAVLESELKALEEADSKAMPNVYVFRCACSSGQLRKETAWPVLKEEWAKYYKPYDYVSKTVLADATLPEVKRRPLKKELTPLPAIDNRTLSSAPESSEQEGLW